MKNKVVYQAYRAEALPDSPEARLFLSLEMADKVRKQLNDLHCEFIDLAPDAIAAKQWPALPGFQETEAREELSVLILAGGRSSRMGRDKALLRYGGTSLLRFQIEKAKTLGAAEVLISGEPREGFEERFISDELPDRGPLGGIMSGLQQVSREDCIILSVDAPRVPAEYLQKLWEARRACGADAALAEQNGKTEPLIAAYRTEAAGAIRTLIENGGAPVRRWLEQLNVCSRSIEGREDWFANCNTPEEYRRLFDL